MKTDGSHASGLPFVPYDGYTATLHRGETILNSNSARDLLDTVKQIANGGATGGNIVLNITNTLDGKVIGETSYRYAVNKQKMLGVS